MDLLRKAATFGGRAPDTPVRVATYNILSPNLCGPDVFKNCDPAALEPGVRLLGVLNQLEAEVKQDAVFGLQEIALQWVGPLQVWFSERGYNLIHTNYSSPKTGYMGVAVAFPTQKYDLLDAELKRLSDTKRWPREPDRGGLGKAVGGLLAPAGNVALLPFRLVRRVLLGPAKRPPEDPWSFSQRRFNMMVSVRLRCRQSGCSFWFSTYHMPCAYFLPPAMVIHSALASQHAAALARANDEPFVLCGDFNIKPGEGSYRLLTEGSLEEDHPEAPEPRGWDSWRPTVPVALKSAYKEVNGEEPDFTNFAQHRNDDPFVDCLDYIFYSPACRATAVRALPPRGDVQGPLPTPKEPSDHILLAATIRVPVSQPAPLPAAPEAAAAKPAPP